jgi:hypothetical protein
MDRPKQWKAEPYPAMCTGRFVALESLLRTSGRDGRESEVDAPSGRAIHPDAVLWGTEDVLVAYSEGAPSQSEAGAAAFASNGIGSDLREAKIVDAGARPSDLSLSFARIADRAAQSGMGDRHYLYPAAAWVCVSDGNHGLVQPLCFIMGAIGNAGCKLLCNSPGMGSKIRPARNFQFRSGFTIHERAVYGFAAGTRCRNQHGWPRSGFGQHLRRAPVADGKIRRGIPEGLRRCSRGSRKPSTLFSVLQLRTNASILGLSDSGTGLFPKQGSDSHCRKTSHGNDRVAMRSSVVGQYRATIICKNSVKRNISGNELIGILKKPKAFSKFLLAQQCYLSIIMDKKPEATIHLKEAVFLS